MQLSERKHEGKDKQEVVEVRVRKEVVQQSLLTGKLVEQVVSDRVVPSVPRASVSKPDVVNHHVVSSSEPPYPGGGTSNRN